MFDDFGISFQFTVTHGFYRRFRFDSHKSSHIKCDGEKRFELIKKKNHYLHRSLNLYNKWVKQIILDSKNKLSPPSGGGWVEWLESRRVLNDFLGEAKWDDAEIYI